jgi:hypothetical protein
MAAPLIYYKPCSIGDTYFRECLTCGAIVKNEGLDTIYHEQQTSPKRCLNAGYSTSAGISAPKRTDHGWPPRSQNVKDFEVNSSQVQGNGRPRL